MMKTFNEIFKISDISEESISIILGLFENLFPIKIYFLNLKKIY